MFTHEEIDALLAAGKITVERANELHEGVDATLKAAEAKLEAISKQEQWIRELEDAPLAGKKRMCREKSVDINVRAAFEEDTFVNRFRLIYFGIIEVPLISFGLRV